MEAAYEAAIKGVGGLEAAKPKAVHEAIVAEFPELTLQARGWGFDSMERAERWHVPAVCQCS